MPETLLSEDEFYELVTRMRSYQKTYFKLRGRDVLIRCKELEQMVDKAVERWVQREE